MKSSARTVALVHCVAVRCREVLHPPGVSIDEAWVAQSSPVPSHVVVFDFDGTLVNRDSFLDFSVRYCVERPGRLLVVVATVPLAMLAALYSRTAAGSVLLWAMTVGASTRRFVAALRLYAQHTLPGHANEAIFEEFARHVQQGSRVVIATGTVPLIVRGLLRARNLDRLPIVGSRFRRRWGGLVVETHCIGATKVQELERRLGIANWQAVYTDSFMDHPLSSRAEHVTLVAPSRRTLLRTRGVIGRSTLLTVLHLDSSPPLDPE